MKKLFTFGIFLFFLVGIGNQVSATIIKSTGTNPPIYVNGVQTGGGAEWNSGSTWVGGVVPTSANADTVQIAAGDSVYSNVALQSCKTLVVSGTICPYGYALYVNGDAIVQSGGILSLAKQVYCKNMYNYGKTWAAGKTNASSTTTVALYVGYNCSATTAVASTDSCTILNDGIIGYYKTPSLVSTTKGCGMFVYYANTVKALNITHSPTVTSGYVFTVVQLAPIATSSSVQTQDLNLYINESLAFVPTSSGLPFGLISADVFTNKRTCTIAAGDTVYVAGYFHKNSAPSSVGPMVYNIYGCLDMASYRQTKNEFDIYTSANSVTVNIGDGTQANAGTLIFGGTINLSAGTANQIVFNPTKYSTVKFNYKVAPVISTLTNVSLSAYNLYVNSYGIPSTSGALSVAGDLTLSGAINNTITLTGTSAQTVTGGSQTITGGLVNNTSGNVSLASALTVTGALTLTSGKVSLGANNLTVGSISGGSSSSYVVTNGTGTLTVPTTSGVATLFPVGASATTSYDPVTITPTTGTSTSVKVTATLSGTPSAGVNYNAREWTVTPSTTSSSTLAFTPSVVDATVASMIANSPYFALIGQAAGGGTYSNSNCTYSSGSYSGTYSSFGGSFVTGTNSNATALQSVNNNLLIYPANNSVVVRNAKVGDIVSVYGVSGSRVASSVVTGDNTTMNLTQGLYIVKTGSTVQKVLVQ